MASENGQSQVSSLPLPPLQYISLFSEENQRRGKTPKPPAIPHDSYSMFGNAFHSEDAIVQPLESQGLRRLYPQHFDPRRELRKLNHSVLASFLDLLELIVRSPDSPRREEKLEDLRLLLIHMHHLVNEFRPHQARETLRVALQIQRRQRLETADRFQRHLDRAIELLQGALEALPGDNSSVSVQPVSPTSTVTLARSSSSDLQVDAMAEAYSGLDYLMCDIVDQL